MPQPRKSKDKAEEILAAATEIFDERGYSAASIQEIATRVGLLKGSLYHHVDSKQELLVRVMVDVHERLTAALEEALAQDEGRSAIERLGTVIHAHIGFMVDNSAGVGVFLNDFRSVEGDERAKVVSLRDRYQQLVGGVIEEGQASGEVRSDLPAFVMTMGLLGMLNWTHQWLRSDGPMSPEDVAEHFTGLVTGGFSSNAVQWERPELDSAS